MTKITEVKNFNKWRHTKFLLESLKHYKGSMQF